MLWWSSLNRKVGEMKMGSLGGVARLSGDATLGAVLASVIVTMRPVTTNWPMSQLAWPFTNG